MSKERKDGLYMDNSIYIIDEKKQGFPIQGRIIQFIAILIGGWGSFGILMESIAIPASYLQVNLSILVYTIVIVTLCLIPSMDLVKLFFGILFYGLFFYSRLPQLLNGFYIAENKVIERLAAYYDFPAQMYVADYAKATHDSTLLLLMIIIPVITLLGIAVMRNHLSFLTGVILLLPIIISFLFGLIPSERYMVAYLVAVLYLSRSTYTNHKIINREQKLMLHRINSRAAIWLCGISLLLFFLLKLILPEQKYEGIEQIKETKDNVQTAMYNFSWEDLSDQVTDTDIFYVQRSSGGLDGGKLGKVGKVEFSDSQQLMVTAPLNTLVDGFYLKGYVGSIYTGDSWEGHKKEMDNAYNELSQDVPEEEFYPLNQISQLIKLCELAGITSELSHDSMKIEYEEANKKFMYIPYFTDLADLKNSKGKQDLYTAPVKKKDTYTIEYYNVSKVFATSISYPGVFGENTLQIPSIDQFLSKETKYRDFVYKAYTILPEEGLERLKQDFNAENTNMRYASMYEKIAYVSDYLKNNTSYSLTPGRLPQGEDYVEYFLYQNRIGYCAHYASAATLMLRAMGVPARYVEGYAVGSADIASNIKSRTLIPSADRENSSNIEVELSVTDRYAHAWVEVYIDNIGWVPYDFTPGSSVFNAVEDREEAADTPTLAPITQAPVNKPDNQEPDNIEKQENKDTSKTDPKVSDADAKATLAAAEKQRHRLDTLFLFLFLLILAGTVFFTYIILINKKKKLRKTWNHNKRAIVLYAEMDKILAIHKGFGKNKKLPENKDEGIIFDCTYIEPEEFEVCMEIVRRARFGKGSIAKVELEQVERLRQNLFERVYVELSFLEKLYLKLFLTLLVV